VRHVPAAPVPVQILNAKKIFIANAGAVSSNYIVKNSQYSGGPNRAYNEFYAAMKNWGRSEIEAAPLMPTWFSR